MSVPYAMNIGNFCSNIPLIDVSQVFTPIVGDTIGRVVVWYDNTGGIDTFAIERADANHTKVDFAVLRLSATSIVLQGSVNLTGTINGLHVTGDVQIDGNVVGNTTFSNNVTINGDLAVPFGAASFTTVAAVSYHDAGNIQILTAQQAAIADATGAGDVVARLNDLLSACRTHGIIAT